MIYLLFIVIITLLIIILKTFMSTKDIIQNLKLEVLQLKNKNEKLTNQIEVNKIVYNKDRELMVKNNNSDSIELKYLKKELSKYSEEQSRYYQEMNNLSSCTAEMSPEHLLKLRAKLTKSNSDILDFTGIYILENKTVDKFYVGQSINVIKRVANHFTNAGNKDVYEDYMAGQEWTIKLISLANSGFNSINALEKHFIKYYQSTHNGYNKTIGNKI